MRCYSPVLLAVALAVQHHNGVSGGVRDRDAEQVCLAFCVWFVSWAQKAGLTAAAAAAARVYMTAVATQSCAAS